MADPVSALEALVAMRERQLISDEEYQSKRAEILSQLNGTPPAPEPPTSTSDPPPSEYPERMTDWKRFALLIFALVALAVVAIVYLVVKSGIDQML
jgi:hypothetical protein